MKTPAVRTKPPTFHTAGALFHMKDAAFLAECFSDQEKARVMIVRLTSFSGFQPKKEAALFRQLPFFRPFTVVLTLNDLTFDVEDDDLAEVELADAGFDL